MKTAMAAALAGLLMTGLAVGDPSGFPTGIYSLGPARDNPRTPQDERLGGIRDYDFVSGFTLRVFWRDIETDQGVYDFSAIDQALGQVSAIGQRLNLEVLDFVPDYVLAGAGATYTDHRGDPRPVPWDEFAQARYAALQEALAGHVVDDGAGRRLGDHPALAAVDAGCVGLNFGVRDLNSGIRSHPDYTADRYVDAVLQAVAVSRRAFARKPGFLAFFGFNDGRPGEPVDHQLLRLLAEQYNGPGQPSLALFIENLSDTGPVPTPGRGGPGNHLLAWTRLGGPTMMQALDSWLRHRPDRGRPLRSRNPATGIALAYETYGTRFFELYVVDLDEAVNGALDAAGRPILDDLRSWHIRLTGDGAPDASAPAQPR